MSTALHTRHLVEHRYHRPLQELRRDAARGRYPGDPVLPILLRRLTRLQETTEQVGTARRHLRDALWPSHDGQRAMNTDLQRAAARVEEWEGREQAEAEAVWDLLDIHLLLHQPGSPTVAEPRTTAGDEELLQAAHRIAPCLPRLTRESLRDALHARGIHASNQRLGHVLHHLRTDHASR